jgi:hypothetical protein
MNYILNLKQDIYKEKMAEIEFVLNTSAKFQMKIIATENTSLFS